MVTVVAQEISGIWVSGVIPMGTMGANKAMRLAIN